MLQCKPLQLCNHSTLHLEKRFSAGNGRHAAIGVESSPAFVARELVERLSGPLTKIDFVQRGIFLNFKTHTARDCFRRFQRSFKRTAVDGLERYSLESIGQPLCLESSFFIQTNIGCAAPQCLAEAAARSVSDEKESRHAIAPAD